MLTDLDKKLIEREAHRFDTKNAKRWLKPITECPIDYDDVINNYNLHEFTMHWYDAGPRHEKCHHCKKSCDDCKIWLEWKGSEAQLSFNNWIDVEGPGIWDMTQEECNERTILTFEEMFNNGGFNERTFYYQPPIKKLFDIFYYNRDRNGCDYWFIFEKKNQVD